MVFFRPTPHRLVVRSILRTISLMTVSSLSSLGCSEPSHGNEEKPKISRVEIYSTLSFCDAAINGCELRTLIERSGVRWVDHENTVQLPASDADLGRIWSVIDSEGFFAEVVSSEDSCQFAFDSDVRLRAEVNGEKSEKIAFYCPPNHPFTILTRLMHELKAKYIKCDSFDPRINLAREKLPVSLACFYCGNSCQE